MFLLNKYETIASYLQSVCEQIRWKKARQAVYQELECHLQDQKDAFLSEGMQDKEAEQKAIAEMGDAMAVGLALDKAHHPVPQWGLLFLTAMLFLVGMCCRLFLYDDRTWGEVVPVVGLGIVLFLGAYFLDFSILMRRAKSIVCVTTIILVLSFLCQTPSINGKPQFLLFSMTSFALWLPLSYISLLCVLRQKKQHDSWFAIHGRMGEKCFAISCEGKQFRFWIAIIGYIGGVCFLIPCALFSNTMIFAISAGFALFLAVEQDWFGIGKQKGRKWLMMGVAVILVIGISLFFTRFPYFMYRLKYFMHRLDNSDPMGNRFLYHLFAGFWQDSQWIGEGIPKSAFLLDIWEVTNGNWDLSNHSAILLEIGFRYGKVFVGLTLALFVIFFIKCWLQMRKQKAILANMTVKVIFLILVLQFLFSVIFQFGIPVLTSFSLPLISWGNTGILLNSILIGFLLSVFRTGQECQQWLFSPINK